MKPPSRKVAAPAYLQLPCEYAFLPSCRRARVFPFAQLRRQKNATRHREEATSGSGSTGVTANRAFKQTTKRHARARAAEKTNDALKRPRTGGVAPDPAQPYGNYTHSNRVQSTRAVVVSAGQGSCKCRRSCANVLQSRAAGGGGEPCWEGSGELTAGGSLVFTAVRVRDPPRQ